MHNYIQKQRYTSHYEMEEKKVFKDLKVSVLDMICLKAYGLIKKRFNSYKINCNRLFGETSAI